MVRLSVGSRSSALMDRDPSPIDAWARQPIFAMRRVARTISPPFFIRQERQAALKARCSTHGNLVSNARTPSAPGDLRRPMSLCRARAAHLSRAWAIRRRQHPAVLRRQDHSAAEFDAAECLREMPRATVLMGVPTFYTRLLRHQALSRETTKHMRLFISVSSRLHRSRKRIGHGWRGPGTPSSTVTGANSRASDAGFMRGLAG